MEKRPSGIKPESWLVSAGRASEPGAPLNVPPIPVSNFIIGTGREYSRDDGTPTWEALEEVVGEFEGASGVTRIQVGRNWSKTLVVGSVIGILLMLILLYVLRT